MPARRPAPLRLLQLEDRVTPAAATWDLNRDGGAINDTAAGVAPFDTDGVESRATDVFLRLDGITGDSTDPDYRNDIEVSAVRYGVANTPATGGASSGVPTFSAVHLTVRAGAYGPTLLQRAATGQHVRKAELFFVRPSSGRGFEFQRLTLDDVQVTGYRVDGGTDLVVSLAFNKVTNRFVPTTSGGTAGTPVTTTYDLVRDGGRTGDETGGAAAFEADGVESQPTDVFLRLDGIAGDSTDPDYRDDIEVSAVRWGLVNPVVATSGGGAGLPTFSAVHVAVRAGKYGPTLLRAAATGEHVRKAELFFVRPSAGGGRGFEFARLTLDDVQVTGYRADGGTDLVLSFAFGKLTERYVPGTAAAPGAPVVTTHDRTRDGGALNDATAGVLPFEADGVESQATNVFLRLDGIAGDSTDPDYRNDIEVSAVRYGVANTPATGGASSGVPTFSAVHLTVRAGAYGPTLLQRAASGQHVRKAELFFVRPSAGRGFEFQRLTLDDVQVTGYRADGGTDLVLSLSFNKITDRFVPTTSGGTAGTPVVTAYDLVRDGGRTGDETGGALPFAADGVESQATDVFLRLDGIAGDSTDPDYRNDIEVSAVRWGLVNPVVATGGGGAGQPTFSAVHVTVRAGKYGPTLLRAVATGEHVRKAELFFVRPSAGGGRGFEFGRLTLDDVLVTGYRLDGGTDLVLSLSFNKVTERYVPGTAAAPGTPVVTTHDRVRDGGVMNDATAGVLPFAADGLESVPTDVFLRLDGIPGNSTDPDYRNDIPVTAVRFGVVTTPAASGGGGAGAPTFSAVHLTVPAAAFGPTLLQRAASGQHIRKAELFFVRPSSSRGFEFARVTLDDVQVTGYRADAGTDLALSLGFSKITDRYVPLNTNGTPGTPVTTTWDRARDGGGLNDASAGVLPFAADGVESEPTDVFLDLDGIAGDSTDPDYRNHIDVTAVRWGVATPLASGGGGGAGAPRFSAVHLTIPNGKYDPTLLRAAATGQHIPRAELFFVRTRLGVRVEYEKVTLDDVQVTALRADGGTDLVLSLAFRKIVDTTIDNRAPTAAARSAATDEDTPLAGTLTGSDPDGDAITFQLGTAPAHGGVVVNPDGTFTYAPAANYFGPDSFTFTTTDGARTSAAATVTLTVNSVNDAPVAVADTATVAEDGSTTVAVLPNDTDTESDPLTITAVGTPANGTAEVVGGAIVYTPAANYFGDDSFTYTVSDGAGGETSATVSVTVTPVPDAPVAVADTATVAEDGSATIAVRANDTDGDGDPLTITAVGTPANGSAVIVNGAIVYTPAANYFGPDSFTYEISDGTGGTASATVSLTVTSVNDRPTAVADTATVAEDGAVTVPVLSNDSDTENDTLTVAAVGVPANGTAAIVGGAVVYTPAANFHGTDSFTYVVSDGNGGTATGTVAVTVTPVNDPPAALGDVFRVVGRNPATLAVLANDSPAPDASEALTILAVTQPAAGGTVAVAPGGGGLVFTPAAGFSGTVSFTYTLGDGTPGSTADGVVTVTVVADAVLGTERPVVVGGAADGSVRVVSPGGGTTTVAPFGNSGVPSRTASADVDGDGVADVIAATGPGTGLRLAVVSGKTGQPLVTPFDPFAGSNFTGGGFVAAADLDGDGRAEFVVSPDQGGGPRVTVYSLNPDGTTTVRQNFFGIDDPTFRGGARAAVGDVNGDGVPDLIVGAGFGGGPRIAIFDGKSVLVGAPVRLVSDFFAFPGRDAETLRNGAFVSAGDVDGDGKADLVFGGGPGGAPRVFVLSGALVAAGSIEAAYANPVANFFAGGDEADRGGARVGVTNFDGDGRADVAVGSGTNRPAKVRVYLGKNFAGGGEPAGAVDLDPLDGAVLLDGVYVG